MQIICNDRAPGGGETPPGHVRLPRYSPSIARLQGRRLAWEERYPAAYTMTPYSEGYLGHLGSKVTRSPRVS